MDIKIIDYAPIDENNLDRFFYSTLFGQRKEYEYLRNGSWFNRYSKNPNCTIKLAKYRGEIVGTLGTIPISVTQDDKMFRGSCFVDNLVSLEHADEKPEIINLLFSAVEKELIKKKFSFIWGWDYEKHLKDYRTILGEGYSSKKNINWISGGFEYKIGTPKKWHADATLLLIFLLLKIYNRLKILQNTLKVDVDIRPLKKADLKEASKLILNCYSDSIISSYDEKMLLELWEKENMRGIVFEKKSKMVGVVPFVLSAWSGWMFGRPNLDKDWEKFYTVLPEIFAVAPEAFDTEIPTQMAAILLKSVGQIKGFEKSKGFVTDVFDQSVSWKRAAYLKSGYLEPEIDLGVIIGKSFDDKFFLDPKVSWNIPPRNIVMPAK